MWLRALSFSSVWLLVASNAASKSSSLEVRTRLQTSRAHYQGENLTQAQEFLKADNEAQADFVRRCQVVVTVSDDKFLPLQPLDRFCQTTDAAVECKLAVGQRLKETHARDGDMGKFCGAVYDWFQGKYGMKCPQQCRKLQCKSTCMWLDAKKKLNKDNEGIKVDMLSAENLLKDIKAVSKNAQEKAAELKKSNFTVKMIGVKIQRAQKDLAEKQQSVKDAQAKKAKVDQAADKLEKTIEATEDQLVKREDSIMKQKFAIDKAKLTLENMERSSARDTDRAKEDREEEKSLKAEVAKISKQLGEVNKQKAAITKTRDADMKAAKDQKTVVGAKHAKMSKAIKELEPFKLKDLLQVQAAAEPKEKPDYEREYEDAYYASKYNKHPSAQDLKELVENQYKRTKAADKILQSLNKKIRDANQEIKELDSDIGRLQKSSKEASDKAAEAKKKAEELEKRSKEVQGKATKFKQDSIAKPLAEMQKAEEAQKKEQASKYKAEKTLKFMQGIIKDEAKKVDVAKTHLANSEMALSLQQKDLAQAQTVSADTQKEKDALEKKAKAMKDNLGASEKAMMDRIKGYKAAAKDLDKHRPEIVRLHQLQPEFL